MNSNTKENERGRKERKAFFKWWRRKLVANLLILLEHESFGHISAIFGGKFLLKRSGIFGKEWEVELSGYFMR